MAAKLTSTFLTGAFMLLIVALPGHALATKPCPGGIIAMRDTNVVFQGRVIWQPIDDVSLVQVDGYYRGMGRRYIFITEKTWDPLPWYARGYKGATGPNSTTVLGARQGLWGYTREPCDFLQEATKLSVDLPASRPPLWGIDLRSVPLFVYLLSRTAAMAVVISVGRWCWKRFRSGR